MMQPIVRASDISGGRIESCEIHKNTNSVEIIKYMSVQHIWNLFSYWGYLVTVNLQIYLENLSQVKCANNVLKLQRVNYVAKNWALATV